MPTLSISPSYSDGVVLTKAQLDTLVDPITTFVNTTKLDSVNVDIDDVVSGVTSSEAGVILSTAGLGAVTEGSAEGNTSLTTTYATVATISAPSSGTFLVSVFGTARSQRDSTVGVSNWAGYIYAKVVNSTTTTQIGPEMVIGNNFAGASGAGTTFAQNRIIDNGFSWNYIVSMSASDSVVVQMYRDNDTGVTNAKARNIYINLTRLIQ